MENAQEKLFEAMRSGNILEINHKSNVEEVAMSFEQVINNLLFNHYRLEFEKSLTMPNVIKITTLGEKTNCFLYNLNTNFENQKDDTKSRILELCKIK